MVTCRTTMQPVVKRKTPSPVQSQMLLSPVTLDMVPPLHQVLSLRGSSRAHTYSTHNVEKEENGKQYSFIVTFNSAWQCPTVRLTCGYLNKLCGIWMQSFHTPVSKLCCHLCAGSAESSHGHFCMNAGDPLPGREGSSGAAPWYPDSALGGAL